MSSTQILFSYLIFSFFKGTWDTLNRGYLSSSPGASLIAQLVRICLQCRRPQFNSWVRKILWRRDRLPIPVFLGLPCGSAGKESACIVGDLSSIPGLGRALGEKKGYPVQYSGLENSMECIVYGVAKSGTQLNYFHFHFQGLPLPKNQWSIYITRKERYEILLWSFIVLISQHRLC